MSKENVQGFYDSTKENEELDKAVVEALVAGNIVALAKEKGFEFSQTEHDEFIAGIAAGVSKMTDDQLEEVAGGWHIPNPQIKVICLTCGWDSGWQSALNTTAALKFVHMSATKLQHLDYEPKARS